MSSREKLRFIDKRKQLQWLCATLVVVLAGCLGLPASSSDPSSSERMKNIYGTATAIAENDTNLLNDINSAPGQSWNSLAIFMWAPADAGGMFTVCSANLIKYMQVADTTGKLVGVGAFTSVNHCNSVDETELGPLPATAELNGIPIRPLSSVVISDINFKDTKDQAEVVFFVTDNLNMMAVPLGAEKIGCGVMYNETLTAVGQMGVTDSKGIPLVKRVSVQDRDEQGRIVVDLGSGPGASSAGLFRYNGDIVALNLGKYDESQVLDGAVSFRCDAPTLVEQKWAELMYQITGK